jgi:DNA invertase Pin-like site-specific DNA recombinase
MITRIRCAIYTRKSSEEGLEQSFNSLHAQREACEAYVKSQQHEGWQTISTHYDDGGFSGGNTERPAFKQLMADINAGKVSVVVVYKVDRLTRSLADFAKIIEQFEKHQVSFVSITQQFNTTTSMGRLTLNVLLSFAQFEREVTGERIRDKIAASKKKGMWMGGTVPLGYLCQERKLIVNESEASTVRTIFNEFLRLKSVQSLRDWLRENNIQSRRGGYFFHGPLYLMLRNPIYLGLIKHKKETYPGEHPAIIARETWNRVQTQLDDNVQGKRRKARVTKESLFVGTLFDSSGMRYTPTHANKYGRRYRYYTSQAVIKKTKKGDGPGRIPAPDVEKEVVDRILVWLQTPSELIDALHDDSSESYPEGFTTQIIASAADVAQDWRSRVASDRSQFLKTIIERIVIHSDHLEICLRVPALINEILGASSIPIAIPQNASIECPFHHVRQGRALRLIIANTSITTDASRRAIIKAIARARTWYEQITSGEISSIAELGAKHNVSARFIRIHMKLVQLSPQSIEKLMNRPEALPPSLSDLLCEIPMNWTAQNFGHANRVQGGSLSPAY